MDKRFKKGECLYVNPYTDVKVYRGEDLNARETVIIKEVVTYEANIANKLLRESWIQSSLVHPNICKLFGQYFFKDGEKFTCGIVMEDLPSDLQAEIDTFRRRNERMPESTLWIYLHQLISALALAQEKVFCTQCISHRDIKPPNLFTSPPHLIKIGDLGAAKTHIRLSTLQTLEGTLSFLSPKVRKQHYDNQLLRINQKVAHNPYKSDVFSLGITVICACLWEIPEELGALERLQEKLDRVVDGLPGYSRKFKEFVSLMVIVEESLRPDFIALRRSSLITDNPTVFLREENQGEGGIPGKCLNCREIGEKTAILRLKCNFDHYFCAEVCLKSYIYRKTKGYSMGLETVNCSICGEMVDKGVVEAVFGGEFPPLPKGMERCYYCKSEIQPLEICKCAHRFCLNCLKTLKKVHGRVPKACPEDQIPFDPENLRKHRAICQIF